MLWRLLLRSVLMGLSALILIYPVNLSLEPHFVWSSDIFPNLPLFGVLFYGWTACLLVLIFTAGDGQRAQWEQLALVVLAALIFRGFWVFFSAIQHQGLLHLNETQWWLNTGKIVSPGFYGDWPGLSTATALIVRVTGLELYPAATLFTLVMTLSIAIGGYALLQGALKSSRDASLACLLVLAGDQWLHILYWPWTMSLGLALLFLSTVFRRLEGSHSSHALIELLLFVALTITHVFGALYAFLTAVAVWSVSKLQRGTPRKAIRWPTLILYLLILAVWLIYWGTFSFGSMILDARGQLSNLPLLDLLINTLVVGQVHVGGATPEWAGITRLFWLAVIYLLPIPLWLLTLRGVRRLDNARMASVGAYTALALISIAVLVLVTGGFGNIRRTITYGGFVSVLVLFHFLQQFIPAAKKVALAGMATVIFFLSLPSFLGQALNTPSWIYYNSEFASGQWLRSLYSNGDGVNVFADVPVYWVLLFDLSHARFNLPENFQTSPDWNSLEGRRQVLPRLIDRFERISRYEGPTFFAESLKSVLYSGPIFGLSPKDPLWEEMSRRLRVTNAQVYDNGKVSLYAKER